MTNIDLRDALKHAASALKAHGPEFALAGSYALWAYGGPEPVHDVDFVVAEEDTEAAALTLEKVNEHHCDFAALLPAVRAVRERVDWDRVRADTAENDFAVAFLVLTDRLGIAA